MYLRVHVDPLRRRTHCAWRRVRSRRASFSTANDRAARRLRHYNPGRRFAPDARGHDARKAPPCLRTPSPPSACPHRSSPSSRPTARPSRSPSRRTPCPTPSPGATCSAAARPARARPSRSRCPWSRASAPCSPAASRRPGPPARPRARADPRARHPDQRDHAAARRRLRPEVDHHLRRRLAAAPGRRRCGTASTSSSPAPAASKT